MKIVVPHTQDGLRLETQLALAEQPDVAFVELGDDEAYWRLLRDLWAQREDVIVVEQDIVPHAGAVWQLENCPEPWCAFGYRYDIVGGSYYGSGCVRWRSELMNAIPNLFDLVGRHWNHDHPARHWCSLDAFTQHELTAASYTMHRHTPPVEHLDPTPSHGCVEVYAPQP